MPSPHLFAHCDQALCLAEDNAVAFFSPKSLKKYRVERLNGFHICGIYIQYTKGRYLLHVIDAKCTWFVISVDTVALISSTTLPLPSSSGEQKVAKPLISARPVSSQEENVITEAHFHEKEGGFYTVLLTQRGVYEISLSDSTDRWCVERFTFTASVPGCTLSVGQQTGLVVMGQRGERWLQFFEVQESHVEEGTHWGRTTGRRVLPIALQSLCCSPSHNNAVAIGGSRGELMVYPDISGTHYFSEHWHHTPLTALQFSTDGSTLFTGGMESALLIWDLTVFTKKKLNLNIGTLRAIVTSVSNGSSLVLVCNTSTLAVVDLLQQRLITSVEGIEWQAGGLCGGLVVEQWMGRSVVVLTGLPDVLRVCDPLTQQAIYSLHVSTQMEVLPNPPRHGILFAGMLRDGRVIVTYENFAGTELSSMLRFWSYDSTLKSHVECQAIYAPHQSEVVSLQMDRENDRVFTLSSDSIKCWEEVEEDVADPRQHISGRSWRNCSSIPTPSRRVENMRISDDGSLCFVADDSVYIYNVSTCAPGEDWPLLTTLFQGITTAPLSDLVVMETPKCVVGFHESTLLVWRLEDASLHLYHSDHPITTLCPFSPHSVLLSNTQGDLTEVSVEGSAIASAVGSVKAALESPVQHMALLSSAAKRVATVDRVSGFRVLNVSIPQERIQEEEMMVQEMEREPEDDTLVHFFREREVVTDDGKMASFLKEKQRSEQANQWLRTVLQDSAFAVAPMSTVFSQYIQKCTLPGQ